MSESERDYHDNNNEEPCIRESKRKIAEAVGDEIVAWESDALSPDVREQFWRRVLEFEIAPWITLFEELTKRGLDLPEPDAMDDAQLTSKLGDVITALAGMGTFIEHTDHLSDRALYSVLWSDVLPDQTKTIPDDIDGVWHVDLLGTGSESDIYLYLKHYADAEWRNQWLADFPDYDIPPHEDAPYDRDRHLPQFDR